MEELVIAHNRRRLGWVLVLTSTAYFMVALDATVVATALPRMQADLHVGLTSLQWTLNSYGIAFAAGIITAAALGDRYGRRLIFAIGLALFTVASAACALAAVVASLRLLPESYGARERLDLVGVGLITGGVVAIVWALVRANQAGWASPEIVTTLSVGAVLLVAFVAW